MKGKIRDRSRAGDRNGTLDNESGGWSAGRRASWYRRGQTSNDVLVLGCSSTHNFPILAERFESLFEKIWPSDY